MDDEEPRARNHEEPREELLQSQRQACNAVELYLCKQRKKKGKELNPNRKEKND